MKTIIVTFGDQSRTLKRYCFRTEADVKPGDVLRSSEYDSDIHVVFVLDKDYKYYHDATGDMSNEITSTHQWPIKTIQVTEKKDNVIYAHIVKD